ncbi:MAG: baseplate J/gp47 family protein [Acutalibacter sp.]|jgi:uncharacterized phage protein gp47/JayE
MESYEEILQRMEEEYEQQSGCKVENVSEVGLRMRVLAGELHRLGTSLDWLERQAFPQTATGVQLDLHGAQRGVLRKPAEKATGVVSFSRYLPLSFDLVIPQGTICATSGEPVVEYETTEEAILTSGQLTVEVPVQAVTAGAAGNAAAGYVTTLVSAPTGINYASNEAAITGGADAETDDDYRKRVLEGYSLSPNGTNADYYKWIALQQEGISQVQVVPRANGDGTVTVYLWGNGVVPSSQISSAVKEELERQREVGVSIKVQAAQQVPITVQLKVKVFAEVDFDWAKEQIIQGVKDYFDTLTIGDGFYLTDLTRAILSSAPVEKYELPAGFADITPRNGILFRCNAVTVEELT